MPQDVKIVWYGERGVVNAMVTALQQQEQGNLAIVKELLSGIEWADGQSRCWIEEIREVSLIVEIGLGHFGDPDLIVVCRTNEDEKPQVVFLEAKVISYLKSAMPNDQGMQEGFNSSINGQLSLKYRFAQSLEHWNGPPHEVAEGEGVHQAYCESASGGGLGDSCACPRHLVKTSVLNILRDAGFVLLPLKNCHFVVLTADKGPFFTADENFLPLFLGEDGADMYPSFHTQVGWIGYEKIEENLGSRLGAPYQNAVKTMIQERARTPAEDAAVVGLPPLTTSNLSQNFGEETLHELGDIEALARRYFGTKSVARGPGSTSVTVRGIVRIKLLPQRSNGEERIMLGVSKKSLECPQLAVSDWKQFKIGVGKKAQPFWVLELPAMPDGIKIADAVFQDVAEQLGLHDQNEPNE